MGTNIEIELSFKSDIPHEVMFELRNYFRQEIPGFEFNIKELPPLPGRMGDEINWINVILYATTVASIELGVHKSLDSINEKIIDKIKKVRDSFVKDKKLEKLDISGSVRYDNTKSSFKIDEKQVHYYNDRLYSINPESTYVLLAGCGEYQHTQINNIPPVKSNITELYQLMIEQQYFGIPADHITISLDENSDAIQDQLYEISRKKGIQTFIFYYVGHGFCTDKDSYFLAAHNTQKKNDFINSGIDKEFIKNKILLQSPAKQKIAIIDACYSGIFTQGDNTGIFENEVKGSYVLTSSNADEVSFYDKNEPYTFFTGALIKTIKEGLNNEKEIITLDDLYFNTCEQLKQKKLQQPTYKNGLNIDPSNFIVSHNPTFSIEIELSKPDELIRQRKFDDAAYLFKKLIKKYPDNKELQKRSAQYDNDLMFTRLVKEGDRNFYDVKDYSKASDCYKKALDLKEDMSVREKLNNCDDMVIEKKSENNKSNVEITNRQGLFDAAKSKPLTENKKISYGKILISFIAISIASAIAFIVFHKESAPGASEFSQGLELYQNYKIKEAIEFFKKSAGKDYKEAYTFLGICNLYGRGVRIDYEEAKRNLEIAKDKGDKIAYDYLGVAYGNGWGVKRDTTKKYLYSKELMPELEKRVLTGDWFAENLLAAHLLEGDGIAVDTGRAIELIKKSAEQGYFLAEFQIGLTYRDGTGVEKDSAKAMNWLRKAADKGYAGAISQLGLIYESKQDYSEAEKWYRIGAVDDGESQYFLGRLFKNGLGVNQNIDSVFYWFEKAGDNMYSDASFELAKYYLFDSGKRNSLKGQEWINKALEQGEIEAASLYGEFYEKEKKDFIQAASWYNKAAIEGSWFSQNQLAGFYETGLGNTSVDSAEAFNLYKSVSLNKWTDRVTLAKALYKLGIYCELGSGTEKNYKEAIRYFEKVANFKVRDVIYISRDACYELAELYKTGGWGIEKDLALADKWSTIGRNIY